MVQNYTAEEREVHLWLDDIDRVWKAESSIQKYIRTFQRAGWKQTASQINDNGTEIYAAFEAPAHAISVRKAEKKERVLTDEQRNAAARRMSEARKSIKNTEKSD